MKEPKTLYLECYSGISGDMTAAALLDLGASEQGLRKTLEGLSIDGYRLEISRVKKAGITACDFNVVLEHKPPCEQGEDSGGHTHPHRNLEDIYHIIDRLEGQDGTQLLAKKIFRITAEAEAKAHGIPVSEVHFHEVGAVDSIIDIVAVSYCMDSLGIEQVIISDIYEGRGHVKCQHGILPVPVPAVLQIVSAHKLPLHITDTEGEMVTPTGAAIAAALCTQTVLPAAYTIEKVGMGAGKKDFKQANLLRAMLIRTAENTEMDTICEPMGENWVIETNLDDCTGESMGLTAETLLSAGAKDVCYLPIYMKKNRPAYMLHTLCSREDCEAVENRILEQTTAIGIRKYPVERTILPRQVETIATPYGEAQVKVCTHGSHTYYYPEYESVKKLCEKNNMDYQSVYHEVMACAKKN